MGWKQIPTGPFDLSGDSDPTLSNDLDTNGHPILLSENLNNGDYSGIVVNGTIDATVSIGDLVSFEGFTFHKSNIESLAGDGNLPVYGICVEIPSAGSGKILVQGLFRNNSLSLPATGDVLYAGSNEGQISNSPPDSNQSGFGVQVIGFSWDQSNNIIYVKPSNSVLRIL